MKKLVIALMAFAIVISLAGCGGGGGGGFTLDRGDNGAALEKYAKDVRTAYSTINTSLSQFESSDSNGEKRTNAIAAYISDSYAGTKQFTVDVSNKAKLLDRLNYLIREKEFKGMEIIPYQTVNGGEENKSVFEKTKLYVANFVQDGKKRENLEYIFEKVKWVNEGGSWKIVSGLDDLGKTRQDI